MDKSASMINCEIYKGTKKNEMYLYVPAEQGLEAVPEVLLESFGELSLVMKIILNSEKKLARVDIETVMEEIHNKGFYLQVPPSTWQLAKD